MKKEFNPNGTIYAEVTCYKQGNPFYSPDTANNGGGYNQPYIEVWLEGDRRFIIDDTSCGDFGSRVHARLENADGESLRVANWGTMEPEFNYSSFESEDIPLLDCIRRLTGYAVPTEREENRYDHKLS